MKKSKPAKDSLVIMTNIVLPNETNKFGHMFGGELLARMDRACAIAASKHSEGEVVTAAVNNVAFNKSIPLGSVVTIEAKVSCAFSTSMEVFVDVWMENTYTGAREKVNEGIYTFVCINSDGKPQPIPALIPETDLERERFAAAKRRRQLSLILAGKMSASEATELKALFMP